MIQMENLCVIIIIIIGIWWFYMNKTEHFCPYSDNSVEYRRIQNRYTNDIDMKDYLSKMTHLRNPSLLGRYKYDTCDSIGYSQQYAALSKLPQRLANRHTITISCPKN